MKGGRGLSRPIPHHYTPTPRNDWDTALCRWAARVPHTSPQAHPAPAPREQERREACAWSARSVPQDQEKTPQEK